MQSKKTVQAASAILALSIGLMSAAQATVIAPTIAYSISNKFGAYDPNYAGDAAQGELTRLYQQFYLPDFQQGSFVSSATYTIEQTLRYFTDAPLGLFEVSNDSWTASTSWSDKAALGTLIQSFNTPQGNLLLTFDVTSFINSQYLGDGIASLAIAGLSEGSGAASWTVFNNASLDYTIAQNSSVPEPGSLALIGGGLIGLFGLHAARRKANRSS